MKKNLLDLVAFCRRSAYSLSCETVDAKVHNFILVSSLYMKPEFEKHSDIQLGGFANYKANTSFLDEWLATATPDFQRSNDKWSEAMQISFIENILKGFKTEILLFKINDGYSQIIDGLQRTTAIVKFLKGDLRIFGGLNVFDLQEVIKQFRSKITFKLYTFNTINDAIQFYIEMNENITHSSVDIAKAKRFLLDLSKIKQGDC